MATLPKTILLVDDDDDILRLTECFLRGFGYAVDCARSAQEALDVFDRESHDLVVTDNAMPGMSGVEMARLIKQRSPTSPVLLYSGMLPEDSSTVDGVLQRPADMEELRAWVARLLAGR